MLLEVIVWVVVIGGIATGLSIFVLFLGNWLRWRMLKRSFFAYLRDRPVEVKVEDLSNFDRPRSTATEIRMRMRGIPPTEDELRRVHHLAQNWASQAEAEIRARRKKEDGEDDV